MDNDEAVLLLVLSGHGSTSKISRMFRKQKKKNKNTPVKKKIQLNFQCTVAL